MAIFVSDTFAGTAGTSITAAHSGQVTGATWTAMTGWGSSAAIIDNANRMIGNAAAASSLFYASGVPGSADYDIEADVYIASATDNVGFLGRCSTSADTRYLCYFNLSAGQITIYVQVNGSNTGSSSTISQTFTGGQSYHLRFSLRGTLLIVFVNGVQVLAFTDSQISAAGRAGIYFFGQETNITGGHVSNYVASTNSLIAPTNTAVFYSPYSWNSVGGSGTMQSNNVLPTGTTAVLANSPGAYLKTVTTAAGSGEVWLVVNPQSLTGITAANCPTVSVFIDKLAPVNTLLVYNAAQQRIRIATGLTAAAHTVLVQFKSVDLSGAATMGDRWNTPSSCVTLAGLETDGQGSVLSAPTIQSNNLFVIGSSESEGADAVSGSALANANNDATLAAWNNLAAGIGAEYGGPWFSAMGYVTVVSGGYGNVPKCFDVNTAANDVWSNYYSGKTRLFSSLLSPAPNVIVVLLGKNDAATSDGTVTTGVSTGIARLRAAAPNAIIIIVIPLDATKQSAITTGVTNAADARTYLVNPSTLMLSGMVSGGNYTTDATHPSGVRGHPILAAIVENKISALLNPTGSRSSSING